MADMLPKELRNALSIFEMPKFMFTKDASGEPNSALVLSWTTFHNNLVYGDIMTYKSRQNLLEGNSEMSLLVMTMSLDSWLVKANFESYHSNDEVYEFMAMTPFFRYNQCRSAEYSRHFKNILSRGQLAACKIYLRSSEYCGYISALKIIRTNNLLPAAEYGNVINFIGIQH